MTRANAHRLLVDGKWIGEKETMAVIDKYTGETIGVVPVASRETVDRAVAAAHAAFPSYSRLPAHKRFRILEKASQLLAKHQDENEQSSAGRRWEWSRR
jgi:malonate-semialdehyde dehydrogenase (acetylating)/methylmalonate-semialdehyde dehydrogenase